MGGRNSWNGTGLLSRQLVGALIAVFLVCVDSAQAAEFACASGNVDCLVTAIRAANGLSGPSTIQLAPGTYTLTVVDNETGGPNGLPSVTGTLSIQGADAQATIIERAADAPIFRLLYVAPTGRLTVDGLTLQRGRATASFLEPIRGGGVLNDGGQVTIRRSRLVGNGTLGTTERGGGLFNNLGTMILDSSTLADNVALSGGGLATSGGSVTIRNSTIVGNRASVGGGVFSLGSLGTIVNSTISGNDAGGRQARGGGLSIFPGGSALSHWTIVSSTIADNTAVGSAGLDGTGGGVSNMTGVVTLQNTIIAHNFANRPGGAGPDCEGSVESIGHNLIENLSECAVALQPSDRTGDPGLAIYTDDGTPGRGHWPLLPTSQAINAGDAATCPSTDQLGRPRLGTCDLGAAEFYPDPNPLSTFVTGFYRYALGREPSPAEVAGWVSFLQADPSPARVRVMAHAFFDGPEYRARPQTRESHVTALYRAILGRDPEPTGFRWVPFLPSFDVTAQIFLRSPEFQALAPCRDTDALRAFVTRFYQQALGRTPGLGEVSEWISRIGLSTCNLELFVSLVLSSEEYRSVPKTLAESVTILYRGLLGREPGPGEVEAWVEYLAVPSLEDRFIESSEFAARWQQLIS